METLVLDLSDYYKKTFGTSPPMVIPIIPHRASEKISIHKKEKKIDFTETESTQAASDLKFDIKPADSNQYSKLGTPYYEKVEGDMLGREFFLPVILDGVKFPYCVVRISCKKTIVETACVNRRGFVHEQINIEDYNIKLRGFVIGENNELPDEQITQIRDLFEKNESLVLRNALTDIFLIGEDKVIIKSIDFPEVKGVKNVRPFEMDIVSDSEFSLIVE